MTLCLRTALAVWPSIPVKVTSPVASTLVLSESLTSPVPNCWLNTSMYQKRAPAPPTAIFRFVVNESKRLSSLVSGCSV